MSYSNPNNAKRRAQQMAVIRQHAGYTATWRAYVSASGGNPALGLGETTYYRDAVITALFGDTTQREGQTPAGQIADADIYAVTQFPLGRRDELIWRGETYRVEADTVPARIDNQYVTYLKRTEV